jgi:hypothetical protein
MPIKSFMDALSYAFPSAAFDNGLANMPWLELMDELRELVCDAKWSSAKDVAFLQDALYGQIGAKALDDFCLGLGSTPEAPKAPARKKALGAPAGGGRGGRTR